MTNKGNIWAQITDSYRYSGGENRTILIKNIYLNIFRNIQFQDIWKDWQINRKKYWNWSSLWHYRFKVRLSACYSLQNKKQHVDNYRHNLATNLLLIRAYPGNRGNTAKRKTTCLDHGVYMFKYYEHWIPKNFLYTRSWNVSYIAVQFH